ncbi:hypothetical protein NE236_00740 [Actinoallomurus purpureus]|uniref:hypothetical protein n=1 Tax=Actinoallomurus purpureus TaxID=478114 RepID=UPI00209288E6|nr:hypothetical protein [Actinoallomurus purpureus]MCO6003503.1 hypothetical protein [Actinoallomurus purpureus]
MGLEALGLMQFGRYTEAVDILGAVVAQQRTYLRNKAYYAVMLADALIGAGEPEGAALTLRESLPTFTEVTSARTFDNLNKVRSGWRPFITSNQEVAECDAIFDDLLA